MSDIEPLTDTRFASSDRVMGALRRIIHAVELNSKRLERRMGLTGAQLLVLRKIDALEGASVGEVALAVSLSQGTITGIINRMEKRDLVMRRRSAADRRRVLVRITPTGRRLIELAPPLMQEGFERRFSRLPAWKQTMILSSLQQLAALMHGER